MTIAGGGHPTRAGLVPGEPRRLAVAVALIAGCTPTSPAQEPAARRSGLHLEAPPVCEPLPSPRPPGATISISRTDPQSLEHTLHVVFVADAACPTPTWLSAPDCVHMTDEAMDAVWAGLEERQLHLIRMEPHGECVHCAGPWIGVTWPGGTCDVGVGHFHDVARASRDRFDGAVSELERLARVGLAKNAAP